MARAPGSWDGYCTHAAGRQAKAEGKPPAPCDRCRDNKRVWSRRVRLEALNHYGGKCFCCGETEPEFLAIDHTDGGGTQHRKKIRTGMFHWWLKKNGWPEGFRVACHNCNTALGHHGYCPHQRSKTLPTEQETPVGGSTWSS